MSQMEDGGEEKKKKKAKEVSTHFEARKSSSADIIARCWWMALPSACAKVYPHTSPSQRAREKKKSKVFANYF